MKYSTRLVDINPDIAEKFAEKVNTERTRRDGQLKAVINTFSVNPNGTGTLYCDMVFQEGPDLSVTYDVPKGKWSWASRQGPVRRPKSKYNK